MTGSASGVTRWAIASENRFSGRYTRTWISVISQPLAGSMSSGQADEAQSRSFDARSRT